MSITIITWNILADSYVRRSYYPRSPEAALDPSKRRTLLLDRVAKLQPDILCLQEVERVLFDEITRRLATGYSGHWIQKSGGKPDGCATFVALDHVVEDVRELHYSDGSDHVALIIRIRDLVIANTHVKWDPPSTAADARHGLREADELLAALRERSARTSAVACGDFNVTADDDVIARFVAAGFRDPYAAMDDVATCVTNGRARRIDYLMTSMDLGAHVLSAPALTDESVLPSATESSDHIPVGITVSRVDSASPLRSRRAHGSP